MRVSTALIYAAFKHFPAKITTVSPVGGGEGRAGKFVPMFLVKKRKFAKLTLPQLPTRQDAEMGHSPR